MPFIPSFERHAREEGRIEGERIGERIGKREGKREGLLQGIEVVLTLKFSADGLAQMAAVQQVEDPKKLQKLLESIPAVKTLKEFRGAPVCCNGVNRLRQDMQTWRKEQHMPFIPSFERHAREEGRIEGEREGKREGLLEGLEVCLDLKFGAQDVSQMSEIREIADLKKLAHLMAMIRSVKTLKEFRTLLSAATE